MSRAEAERRGRRAETIAAWWLRLQGWRIIGNRIRTPVGEIDLIARRGSTVTFVEVKARQNEDDLGVAIDERRLRRVVRAAEGLIPRYAHRGETVRIDVILIMPRRLPRHLKNVWHG